MMNSVMLTLNPVAGPVNLSEILSSSLSFPVIMSNSYLTPGVKVVTPSTSWTCKKHRQFKFKNVKMRNSYKSGYYILKNQHFWCYTAV